ncbi:MAG: universal stress protein [Bacteroidota bacterium]|nr:universal stress protein [Bacteroidota bacterium]
MKILLATDGSQHCNAAIQEVAGRPFPLGTEVLVVSVYESNSLIVSQPAPMGGLAGSYEEAKKTARKIAEDAVTTATEIIKEKNTALSISTIVINDSPKHGILKEAESFGADLIVVGSHGRGTIGRFLLGSVSQSVALHASCSVLIVRIPSHVKDKDKTKKEV